ncbi:MAG TPA: sugar phosphate nucleotidyltransferase [Thermoanaerobaculia bacterium]|nr:sugar phosphate nucleotidyltransferase [Thermoanaerobaculia bacterium]
MKVAILCGGLGTRIREFTGDLPKPMLPVGGRPYLEYVIESFTERGLRDFVLLTGYRSDVIEEHFGDGKRFGARIRYSVESHPLGTGGALREARALLGSRFLLTYGDVLRRFDYAELVRSRGGNCLAVYPRLTIGNADVSEGWIVAFDKRAPELPYLDAGFALLETSVISLLPSQGSCSFEEIVYSGLAQHMQLRAEIVDHNFFDIGTPEELARTRAALESA